MRARRRHKDHLPGHAGEAPVDGLRADVAAQRRVAARRSERRSPSPRCPPAPPLLSTTTLAPGVAPSRWAMRRPSVPVVPPAANGSVGGGPGRLPLILRGGAQTPRCACGGTYGGGEKRRRTRRPALAHSDPDAKADSLRMRRTPMTPESIVRPAKAAHVRHDFADLKLKGEVLRGKEEVEVILTLHHRFSHESSRSTPTAAGS